MSLQNLYVALQVYFVKLCQLLRNMQQHKNVRISLAATFFLMRLTIIKHAFQNVSETEHTETRICHRMFIIRRHDMSHTRGQLECFTFHQRPPPPPLKGFKEHLHLVKLLKGPRIRRITD